MKIGRNESCPCGSGKKHKRCCMNKVISVPSQEDINRARESLQNQQLPEPHLHIIKSIVWQNYRWRVIWNKVRYRPLKETFHEFIISILLSTYGEGWRKSQMTLPENERHVLIRWVKSYVEWKNINQKDENKYGEIWGAVPSGEVMALLQFAYDIYCLQTVNRLPNFLINRIKEKNEFQGVRYEIAVAAIIARAGFDITFLDDKIKGQKHCEFIAKNKYSGEEIGVEAKSRRRKGVLHEKGDLKYSELIKGDVHNLFNEALYQKPNNMPYFIFIDLNIISTPKIPFEEKSWIADIKSMFDKYRIPSKENSDPFSVLVLTNFCYYYGGNTGATPQGEYCVVISQFPEYPCRNQAINEIWESLDRYSYIPKEI